MSFSGTTESDFMKLVTIPERNKKSFLNFAANDFGDIKDTLIKYIRSVYPLDYQNFSESDLGVMLIELVAYMGAVNSLKTDMLANENFITTVKTRRNLGKLLELIGVKMRGPTAAAAAAQISVGTVPPEWPLSTGTTPDTITIAASDRVLSVISNEDGAPVNYTVYKTLSDGSIQNINNASVNLTLYSDEGNATSSTFSNLALLEGSLVVQTGVFNTAESSKSITLTDSPIIDGSVNVFVEDSHNTSATGPYVEVPKLFSSSGASDKVFTVIYDESYGATVLFGDGILGANPAQDATFTVSYRVGGGTRGNMGSEVINVAIPDVGSPTDGHVSVTWTLENITKATGGAQAETMEHAKTYAPYTFKRQDRVVTLEDYITFVNTFQTNQGTIGKATAVTRDAFSSANVIEVYILEKATDFQLQRATPATKKDLLDQIESKKMMTDHVVVSDGLIRTLDLVTTIRIDKELIDQEEAIKQKVASTILNFFSIDNFDFGKEFIVPELNRAIFQIPQVRYATIDNIKDNIKVNFNEIIQLNNFKINVVEV